MQRRYPGGQGGRSRSSDWQERDERAYRGVGRGITDEPSPWPEEAYESAYHRFRSEDVGPEDWGSEWSERAARSPAEERSAGWRDAPAGAREPGRGYGERRRDPQRTGGERGGEPQWRTGGYRGERGYDPRDARDARDPRDDRPGEAPDLSRFGGGAMRARTGPKGYTRSDERIREDVCERLARALEIDVSDVSVEVRDGCVVLEGTVPTRWMKHDIEDLSDDCMGVRDVENRVRVRRDGEHDTGTVLRPSQRTVTPTRPNPNTREPEPESGSARRDENGADREPRH